MPHHTLDKAQGAPGEGTRPISALSDEHTLTARRSLRQCHLCSAPVMVPAAEVRCKTLAWIPRELYGQAERAFEEVGQCMLIDSDLTPRIFPFPDGRAWRAQAPPHGD